MLSVPPTEVERAKALRNQLDIHGPCIYWHCASGARPIQDELKAVLTDPVEQELLENTYHMFKLLSMAIHTSPLHTAFFDEAPGGGWPWRVKEQYLADEIFAGSVLLAIQIFRMWGLAIGKDVTEQAIGLVRRLHTEESS